MKRKYFYPSDIPAQPEWHLNFAAKLQLYGLGLGLTQEEIDDAVADNRSMAYALGVWINNVREYAPACTSSITFLARGTGDDDFVFPVYVAPAAPTLPVGITGVRPGALDRTLLLAKRVKTLNGYTESIGLDMGIIGSELPPPPPPGEVTPPEILVSAISGTANEYGRVKFVKGGHEYVVIQCSTNGGPQVELGMSNKSPFIDTRPLAVPGQAEIREYSARYYDNGAPSSNWCGPEKVTISP